MKKHTNTYHDLTKEGYAAAHLGLLTRACIVGILLGIIGMIQPFVFGSCQVGVLLLLVATWSIRWSRTFPTVHAAAEADGTEDMPIAWVRRTITLL